MKVKEHTEDIIVHLSFGALLIAAILFFEERIVADAAFYLSKIINEESFHVEHQRYILALSQWLPLLFVKLHLPLKAVVLASSIGHVLFFYSLFLVCRYLLHERIAGWWLLLCQTAGLLHGFFVPMFEVYYAAGLLVLVYSLRASIKPLHIMITVVCMFFIMTSHLSAIFLLLWLFVILYLDGKLSLPLIFSFIGILCFIGMAKVFFISEYEDGKISAALESFQRNTYGLTYIGRAFKFLVKIYPEIIILSLSILFYTARTDRKNLAVFGFFFVLIFAGIHFQYYGFERSRYQEQVYFPLTVMTTGTFLIFLIGKDKRLRVAVLSAAFIIFTVRFGFICHEANIFKKRAAWFKTCISEGRKVGASKCVLEDAACPPDVLDPNWSFPIETMIFSSYAGPENAVTVCLQSDLETIPVGLDSTHFLFRRLEVIDDSNLNPRYFKLKPETYRVIHPH